MRVARPTIVLAATVALTVSLGGCDVLAPTRNSDGTIARAIAMPSTEAWVGDCFNFVEGSDLSWANVVPCTQPHSYVVIGKGTLSKTKLSLYESLQIAVITECKRTFTAYAEGRDPEPTPEYIVATEAKPGGEVKNYSCLATDAST